MANQIRQDQKERTRKQLISSALDCFAREGLAEARTSDIASAAKVSHGTVFLHFPTRDDLLAAAIGEFGTKVTKRLHELAEKGGSVRSVLRAHLAGLQEHEQFYMRLITQGSALPLPARTTMIAIQSAISFHLIRAAQREMSSEKIRRMPYHLFFNTWIGLIHHYLANAELFAPGKPVLKRYGPELLKHFLALISK
jgi:AcrR family transcriptional regulator